MSQPTPEQAAALRTLIFGVIDAVKAAGDRGAPSGVLYAALMQYGCTLSQFQSLMDGLVKHGRLTQKGDLYFLPTEGNPA